MDPTIFDFKIFDQKFPQVQHDQNFDFWQKYTFLVKIFYWNLYFHQNFFNSTETPQKSHNACNLTFYFCILRYFLLNLVSQWNIFKSSGLQWNIKYRKMWQKKLKFFIWNLRSFVDTNAIVAIVSTVVTYFHMTTRYGIEWWKFFKWRPAEIIVFYSPAYVFA